MHVWVSAYNIPTEEYKETSSILATLALFKLDAEKLF